MNVISFFNKKTNEILRKYEYFFFKYYLPKKKELLNLSDKEFDERIEKFFEKSFYALKRYENFLKNKKLEKIIEEGKHEFLKNKKQETFEEIVDDSAWYYFYVKIFDYFSNNYGLEVSEIESGKFCFDLSTGWIWCCDPIILDDIEYKPYIDDGYIGVLANLFFADNGDLMMDLSPQSYFIDFPIKGNFSIELKVSFITNQIRWNIYELSSKEKKHYFSFKKDFKVDMYKNKFITGPILLIKKEKDINNFKKYFNEHFEFLNNVLTL